MSELVKHITLEKNIDTLKKIHDFLQLKKIDEVIIYFFGEGDSGQTEMPEYLFDFEGGAGDQDAYYDISVVREKKFEWVMLDELINLQLDTIFKDQIAEQMFIDQSDTDWYNNEGGGGQVTINTTTWPWSIDFRIYYNEVIHHESDECFQDQPIDQLLSKFILDKEEK